MDNTHFAYSVTVYRNSNCLPEEPGILNDESVEYLTVHRAVLLCLVKYLRKLSLAKKSKARVTIIFCTPNENVKFEWMTEYQQDKCFSKQTEDKDIWVKIQKFTEDKNISLIIKGNESLFAGMAWSAGRRL